MLALFAQPKTVCILLHIEMEFTTWCMWQVGIGATLALAGAQPNAAWIALFFMCFYICAYAWSWGPLPWLYAAEVQFLETRSAGQSIATLINLLFSFVIGQVCRGCVVSFPGPQASEDVHAHVSRFGRFITHRHCLLVGE
jgi:mannose/fructose/N-acetylgalactosamine-specific phosphotransferase system component IID